MSARPPAAAYTFVDLLQEPDSKRRDPPKSSTILGVKGYFAILNPCAKRWEELRGGGRKRFCPECQTYVHSLAEYAPQEIISLKKAQGRLCGYMGSEPFIPPRARF